MADFLVFILWEFITNESSFPFHMPTVNISPLSLMRRSPNFELFELVYWLQWSFNKTINMQSCFYWTKKTHFNLHISIKVNYTADSVILNVLKIWKKNLGIDDHCYWKLCISYSIMVQGSDQRRDWFLMILIIIYVSCYALYINVFNSSQKKDMNNFWMSGNDRVVTNAYIYSVVQQRELSWDHSVQVTML